MIDPSVTQAAKKVRVDMKPYFADCIGCVLERIDFGHEVTVKGSTRYSYAIIYLHFSNGKCIRFSNNFGKTPKEKYAAFFEF